MKPLWILIALLELPLLGFFGYVGYRLIEDGNIPGGIAAVGVVVLNAWIITYYMNKNYDLPPDE